MKSLDKFCYKWITTYLYLQKKTKMEKFINLLIIDDDEDSRNSLIEILTGSENNLLLVNSVSEAIPILKSREIGVLIVDIDTPSFVEFESFKLIKESSLFKNCYIIAVTSNSDKGVKMMRGLNDDAIDFCLKPLDFNLIVSKVDLYRILYYKDQKINQLMNSIFPEKVVEDIVKNGKFVPQKIEEGVVLFVNFVDFSNKISKLKPVQLIAKLEYYFAQFDEIVSRYKLEKIKSIGDSYLVIGGVTELNNEPIIRACLAAIEIRNFMLNDQFVAAAMGLDSWEIRIGIHAGPLVAGVMGPVKHSFDVWGDTVNVAKQVEKNAGVNNIVVTGSIFEKGVDYFEFQGVSKESEGVDLYSLEKLKNEYSLYKEGKIANDQLRSLCDLSNVDFDHMRKDVLNRLKSSLPDEIIFHDLSHTLNVEKSALRLAKLEGIGEEETMLLQTAVLYHDTGFILSRIDHEFHAVNFVKVNLPKFGYTPSQIDSIIKIIESTNYAIRKPITMLERIMSDADHDYFGRSDYSDIAQKLRQENENFGEVMSDKDWISFQLDYLENKHEYYTETAKNLRSFGKKMRIQELKKELAGFEKEEEIEYL